VSGINWVVSQGAKVVNLSLGDAGTGLIDQSQLGGSPLATALQNAWNAGAIGVVAAGNNSNGLLGLGQSNYAQVPAVVVAATGPQNSLASYSNSIDSADWGVAAPGGDDPNGPTAPTCGANDSSEILSTYWTSSNPISCYATDEGTSMATPFVSGTLALLLGRGLSPSQAVQALLATANHAVSCGSDCSGLINADAAMARAAGASSPTAGAVPSGQAPAPAPGATSTRGALSASSGSGAQATTLGTSAGPTTTAATSRPATTTVPPPMASLRRLATIPHAGGGGSWWIVLPVLLGLAALTAAGIGVRRMKLFRPAVTQQASSSAPGPDLDKGLSDSGS
ncbi:MAG: S8 family serine peptidase, partial [Acidimicrobiales bacterium]